MNAPITPPMMEGTTHAKPKGASGREETPIFIPAYVSRSVRIATMRAARDAPLCKLWFVSCLEKSAKK